MALVDVRLPPTFTDEGIRAALAARREVPGLPVLVLSQYVEQLYARELLASGSGGIGYEVLALMAEGRSNAAIGQRLVITERAVAKHTASIFLKRLGYRRTRWPDTANPRLLINQQSAMGTGPVSTIYYAKTKLRGQAATLERLRVDRQLEEALAHGPDPLHLAAVFGLDPKTAIRYAENARLLLETSAEQQAARVPSAENSPASSPHTS